MPQSEADFWKLVRNSLFDELTHHSRIENTAGTGISDINACRGGVEAWLELKVAHGNQVHFRTSQKIWILKRTAAGGRVWVLVRFNDSIILIDGADAMRRDGKVAASGKSFSVNLSNLHPVVLTCKPFDWRLLREIIFA